MLQKNFVKTEYTVIHYYLKAFTYFKGKKWGKKNFAIFTSTTQCENLRIFLHIIFRVEKLREINAQSCCFHEIFVKNVHVAQYENYRNLLSLFFGKNFVKVTYLLNK